MNHCRRCDSDYQTPRTCNCFDAAGRFVGCEAPARAARPDEIERARDRFHEFLKEQLRKPAPVIAPNAAPQPWVLRWNVPYYQPRTVIWPLPRPTVTFATHPTSGA